MSTEVTHIVEVSISVEVVKIGTGTKVGIGVSVEEHSSVDVGVGVSEQSLVGRAPVRTTEEAKANRVKNVFIFVKWIGTDSAGFTALFLFIAISKIISFPFLMSSFYVTCARKKNFVKGKESIIDGFKLPMSD